MPDQFRTQNLISSKWINSTEMLDTLFIKEYGGAKQPDDCYDIGQVIKAVKTDEFNCIMLSNLQSF